MSTYDMCPLVSYDQQTDFECATMTKRRKRKHLESGLQP
jgi:hypothetical protein